MISLEMIEREISELEARETSYKQCERLSVLYTVRDHLLPRKKDELTTYLSGSEFLELASGVSYPALMQVMNEHMQTLSILQPRVYQSILDKIRDLRSQVM